MKEAARALGGRDRRDRTRAAKHIRSAQVKTRESARNFFEWHAKNPFRAPTLHAMLRAASPLAAGRDPNFRDLARHWARCDAAHVGGDDIEVWPNRGTVHGPSVLLGRKGISRRPLNLLPCVRG